MPSKRRNAIAPTNNVKNVTISLPDRKKDIVNDSQALLQAVARFELLQLTAEVRASEAAHACWSAMNISDLDDLTVIQFVNWSA